MELFHEWHGSHLTARLAQLAGRKEPLLILGVCKALEKDPLVFRALEQSEYFARFGFVFRQMPTAGSVLPILERILAEEGHTGEREREAG